MSYKNKTKNQLIDEVSALQKQIKYLEKQIREREKVEYRFRTVAESANDWEYWSSPEGAYLWMSPSCERVTGYKVDEFIKQPQLMNEIIHPDDRALISLTINDKAHKTHLTGVDFRIITKEGEERWVNHVCQPVYGPSGELTGRRASNRDVTDRKKAENDVEAINNLLKKTFEGMAEGVVGVDKQFFIRMISANACHMLDIEEEKALGKPAVTILGSPIAGPSGELVSCIKKPGTTLDVSTFLLSHSGAQTPVNLSVIPLTAFDSDIRWLLLFRDLRKEERLLREKASSVSFGSMISCDPKMNEIFALIEKVALSSAAIMIKGESGTGKELAAKEIHQRSLKARGPFLAVNCAAISPNLMESEFFGHEQGAFTGADKRKPGRFELADKGTLFLDEVGDIPLDLQGKLLRVLQEQEFERVGGTKTIQVDVRVIAATNKNLQEMVQAKQFRDDLYYRLNVIPISLPPLREKIQDIPLLVSYFIGELNRKEHRSIHTISPDALRHLLNHSWPGNIRELYNAIEYAFAVSEGTTILEKHLPLSILDNTDHRDREPAPPKNEKELILQALQQTNFSKPKAASLLGVHRTTLYRKIKKYNL
ncbi:sigma 54-interacting transcriptional regulator [bacterium]|nr:sigma 54-interacting transcriptional regulator [bacterium]